MDSSPHLIHLIAAHQESPIVLAKNIQMISKLSFKNYKAFNEGKVEVRPITILLGANSVGKSSIMQLFLMLQQTALSESNYKSALKLHGGFVSLGEGLNLMRKKDSNNVLTIRIDFKSSRLQEILVKDHFTIFLEQFFHLATLVRRLYDKKGKNVLKSNKIDFLISEDLEIKMFHREQPGELMDRGTFSNLVTSTAEMSKTLNLDDLPTAAKEDHLRFVYPISRTNRSLNLLKILRKTQDEFLLAYDFLQKLANGVKTSNFHIQYDIVIDDKILVLNNVSFHNEENEILTVEFDTINNSNVREVRSKFINKDIVSDEIYANVSEIFRNPRTIFSFVEVDIDNKKELGNGSIFSGILSEILVTFNRLASENFKNDSINYVNPLRAHPKRYYFLDKAKINAYVDTLDGDAIAEILKQNTYLKYQVNTWLEKFNLKVDVSQLQDVIHRLVVNQNSLSLDITDVGFGISQVLPVIIQGFLSKSGSLTLIEQPEIHLHPKMQAELADLFIDIVKLPQWEAAGKQKYLLIETHSEYLLKRLRRRISEGVIAPDQVAIYLVDPQSKNEGASIRELQVLEKGQFEWPNDFYGGELLRDTTEFLKNQQ